MRVKHSRAWEKTGVHHAKATGPLLANFNWCVVWASSLCFSCALILSLLYVHFSTFCIAKYSYLECQFVLICIYIELSIVNVGMATDLVCLFVVVKIMISRYLSCSAALAVLLF